MSDDINRQIFKEEAYDLLGELESALLELEEAPDDMDVVNQIFRALHTIKGSGAMFGFDDIAEFTHEVENVFDMVRNGDLGVSQPLCNLALKSRDYIKLMLDNSDEGEIVDPSTMAEILNGLKVLVSGEDEVGEAEDDQPTDSGLEIIDEASAPEEAGEAHNYQIILTAKDGAEVDEPMLESLFDELVKLGEFKVVTRPGDIPGSEGAARWELSLVTDIVKDNVADVFFFVDADLTVEIEDTAIPSDTVPEEPIVEDVPVLVDEKSEPEVEEPVVEKSEELVLDFAEDEGSVEGGPAIEDAEEKKPAAKAELSASAGLEDVPAPRIGEMLVESGEVSEKDIQEALRKQKPIGQILAEEGKIAPDKLEKVVKKQSEVKEKEASKKRQEAMSSIRVAADKLDFLVDLVGELVIVQAQITQVVSERNDPQMTALAEELERLSDELRDSTLGIRMLPIGTSFSKFKRLIRDLSSELGKEIGLSTSGEDTELDKTVIERLGDPLVHLLRNSLDHGIESPEERKAVGKPPQGMILLAAEHSGGEVLIRITDDGRGMSTEAIREKAIERGLITKDTELTEKELLKLIFEPGFSTAKEVTNVSGRGVGMDVVKRAIDSLRGTIDIDSIPGKGTTITIRLPLTLAIIDGLQVRVEDEYYVIPLSLVEECVELSRAEVEDNETGQRILHLRGEIVPYIHIRDWFGIEGDNPPIEQIVITGVEGSRVGIVVDTVIGEHQTVIKSLSRVYKDVEGISGATIKGDGSIALILDVPSLVRRVVAESK
ncbi:chemotaxis protein CheA [Pseudodesulfovibrio sp. zrk46]|uniref:chemotaxis protein CheA n=1 Tax=Pseudodesulfovibrio sp. zrk46 TaxID=2725288 RepID=UPI001448BC93|nr:chemotaxis protein CheA [Pseudodesulfovibrio sp. zrk46]QJB57884.1 chemotaxis protein CheA [Pseudodesulfovibrio sp. zrk46]